MDQSQLPSARAAVAEEFRWPAPPYSEFLREKDRSGPVDCLLVFKDGTRASGRVSSFLPDEALLTFLPGGASETASVEFFDLLQLQLPQPVDLTHERLPPGMTQSEELPPLENYAFCIELVNGDKFQGVTRGYVSALCGLFLYLPEANGVVRHFVPALSAKTCRIDAPIGQILIDQKAATPEAVGTALNMQAMMRTQTLGQFLTANGLVSPLQLARALALQRERPTQKLGEALIELGFITRPELEMALGSDAMDRTMPLGQILKKMGVVDEQAINEAMANKLGIPTVSLKVAIPRDILGKIPAAVALRHRVLPVCEVDGALVVAIEDPTDGALLADLRAITRMKIVPVTASAEGITASLRAHYGTAETSASAPSSISTQKLPAVREPRAAELPARNELRVQDLISRLTAESGNLDITEQQAVKSDSALVMLVNRIILDAVQQKASDIHIEANPAPRTTKVRFRKDGILVNYLELPSQFRNAVISRIKIMSQLDITDRRKPQDGKVDFSRFGPAPVELRIATIPTTGGLEDVVMRILAASSSVSVDDLGLEEKDLDSVKRLMARPHGLFLVCGPTGSGKTTTLHSLLAYLNTAERKIWTAEDPIEITQTGLRQVQVNAKIGWTFAAAMRSFMRADPDVIMVGEMRDAETAKIGIEASLTGHLVLSTLHTNGAPESIVRLLDLGMDPFNFADALLGVLAQRLAKRLCPHCKIEYTPNPEELEELASQYCSETPIDARKQMRTWTRRYGGADGKFALFRARGCNRCDQTGYRGRIGLHELLVADPAAKRLVQSRAPVAEVKDAAMAAGMRTLRQDGIDKVFQGLTDIRQVSAVCS